MYALSQLTHINMQAVSPSPLRVPACQSPLPTRQTAKTTPSPCTPNPPSTLPLPYPSHSSFGNFSFSTCLLHAHPSQLCYSSRTFLRWYRSHRCSRSRSFSSTSFRRSTHSLSHSFHLASYESSLRKSHPAVRLLWLYRRAISTERQQCHRSPGIAGSSSKLP